MGLIILYPEALSQHPNDATDVLTSFLFSIPIGLMTFIIALWILIVGTLIKKRTTSIERHAIQVVVRAAIPIGAAFTMYLPIMSLSEITGEVLAFSMAVAMLIAGVIFAWFVLRRCRLLKVPRPFPDLSWVLVLAMPMVIATATSIHSVRWNAAIANRQVKTEGVILDCLPHNPCRFTFSFLGRSFEGAGTPSTGSKVGHPITVFFDPDHPQTTSLQDFARTGRRQVVMVLLCLIAILALLGASIYAARRQSRTSNHLLKA